MIRPTYPPEFERLYAVYPKKRDKGAALTAFIKLEITGEDVDWLIPKVLKYAKLCKIEEREQRYIKSMGPWLNNCIDDEIDLPETPAERNQREKEEYGARMRKHGVEC